MQIQFEDPDQADVRQLIADLDAYQDSLYPAESRYALDLASLRQPNVRFAVARAADGAAIGCGAVVLHTEYGELKRMYVAPAFRGQAVAHKVLALLEEAARTAGCRHARLETGPFQPQALSFYTRSGYQTCGRYGDYRDDPLSVFMAKPLDMAAGVESA